jgi:RNA 3'-terminal phosphate cyclase (ATP)
VPHPARGEHRFAIGTAGSTTLVLQTVLPPLWQAAGAATLILEGGTHNPAAPPADFLIHAYAPLLRRMGVGVEIELERHGFFPAGGGALHVKVTPGKPQPLKLNQRGETKRLHAQALLSSLPGSIGERELAVIARRLGIAGDDLALRAVPRPVGPGNAVSVFMEFAALTEVMTGFGEQRVSAEAVAERLCDQAQALLASDAAVGPHLADQLLLPMALAGGGEFTTLAPTNHLRSNAALIEKFLPVEIEIERASDRRDCWAVKVIGYNSD